MKPALASGSSGNSRRMKRTGPVSMWNAAQCEQVSEAYSTIVTLAFAGPSATSPRGPGAASSSGETFCASAGKPGRSAAAAAAEPGVVLGRKLRQRRARRPGPRHRALLQDQPADAAPAVMGVDALDEERREVLQLEREGALDAHDQRRRLRPRVGVGPPAARPFEPDRARKRRQPVAGDLGPGRDHVGSREALRAERRAEAAVDEIGEGLRTGHRFVLEKAERRLGSPAPARYRGAC